MLPLLLKRFLTALPALWLLATLVFLLSRLLPGSFAAERILQEEGGFFGKSHAADRQAAYRDYLRKTGQHLPLFYFSISAYPEPDTLALIYPETEREYLRQLAWRYGNWPAVAAYYKHLKALEQALAPAPTAALQATPAARYTQTNPAALQELTSRLVLQASPGAARAAAVALQQQARKLLAGRRAYAYLLPAFTWHGADNQYHQWLLSALQGNLGNSYRSSRPVPELLGEAVATTWWLIFMSLVLAFAISLELGMLLASQWGQQWRRRLLPCLFLLDSIPLFVLALLLLVLLASPSFLQLFPVYGLGYYTADSGTGLQKLAQQLPYMALPLLCLTLANIPYLTNQFYSAIATALHTGYVRTARAKGLSEKQILRRHVLRNALLPAITILSDALPALLAGSVVIETIFAIPGMGRLLVESVAARDYPVIVGIVLLVATAKALSHIFADWAYGLADPRIRIHKTRA